MLGQKRYHPVKKSYFLLLEVLLAMGLVVSCMGSLISPHLRCIKELTRAYEERVFQQLSLQYYADMMLCLYENENKGEKNPSLENFEIKGASGTISDPIQLPSAIGGKVQWQGSWQLKPLMSATQKEGSTVHLLQYKTLFRPMYKGGREISHDFHICVQKKIIAQTDEN